MVDRGTRVAAGVGGLLFAIGGPLHPNPESGVTDLDTAMLGQLEAGGWVVSHTLLLLSYICITAAVVMLVRRLDLSDRLRWVGRVAAAGAVLTTIEMVFHLLAVREADAFRAGGSTPLLDAHIALSAVAYPIMGLALAVFIAVLGWRRQLTNPVVATIGALGAVIHGIAPPLIIFSGDPDFSALFPFTTLLVVWLIAVAVRPQPRSRHEPAPAVA